MGIASIQRELPATATQEEIEAVVRELNEDPACTGYIVQLPLPKGIDENRILELMDPAKDADGLHPMNLGRLVLNEPAPLPCTPNGILTLLRRHGVEIKGAEVVVVGRGVTIGRPMPLLLTRRSENATVTQCHTGTRDLSAHLKRADIVIAAAGSPAPDPRRGHQAGRGRPGRRCLRNAEGKIVGDVHPDVTEVAGWISPEPRRCRPDDPDAAAGQRGRGGGAQCRLRTPAGRRNPPCATRSAPLTPRAPASRHPPLPAVHARHRPPRGRRPGRGRRRPGARPAVADAHRRRPGGHRPAGDRAGTRSARAR